MPALLCSDHGQIVPRLRIFRTKLDRLLKIDSSVRKRILSKIKCAEVVIGFGIGEFGGNDLFEGSCRLVEIAALKKRDAVSEIIALETALVKCSVKRKSFAEPLLVIFRNAA